MNRKKENKKELQDECRKRNVGFMATWSKIALMKRLEEEDIRDETQAKTMKELVKTQEEVKLISKKSKEDIGKVKKELDNFEGARKPDDIRGALKGEREIARKNYNNIKDKIDKASAVKAALSVKYDEAKAKLKNVDDAISTLNRVL